MHKIKRGQHSIKEKYLSKAEFHDTDIIASPQTQEVEGQIAPNAIKPALMIVKTANSFAISATS